MRVLKVEKKNKPLLIIIRQFRVILLLLICIRVDFRAAKRRALTFRADRVYTPHRYFTV